MEDGSPFKDTDGVLGHLVIEGGWELHEVSCHKSFHWVVNEVGESSNWEEDWKTNTVHHCYESYIQYSRVLEVDVIFGSTVQINVDLHGGLLGLEWVTSETVVQKSEGELLAVGNTEFNEWEDGVDDHSLGESVTNLGVPWRSEIIEWSLEQWGAWEANFFKVSWRKEQEDTSVEELSSEYTISDRFELLWVSIFTDPLDQSNHDESEDGIDDYNDEWHETTNSQTNEQLVLIVVTYFEAWGGFSDVFFFNEGTVVLLVRGNTGWTLIVTETRQVWWVVLCGDVGTSDFIVIVLSEGKTLELFLVKFTVEGIANQSTLRILQWNTWWNLGWEEDECEWG